MSRRAVWSVALSVVAIALLAAVAVGRLACRPPGTGYSWSSDGELVGAKIVVVDDVAISVIAARPIDASPGVTGPAKGNRFMIVEVRVENRGTAKIDTPDSDSFSLETVDAYRADYAPIPNTEPDPPATIAGNGAYNVRLAFEVPASGPLTFTMEPNSITGSIVQISLVPAGGPGPKTETRRTETEPDTNVPLERAPAVKRGTLGQPIVLSQCTLTVLYGWDWQSEYPDGGPWFGHRYFGVRIRVKNNSAEYFDIVPEYVRLQDASGDRWDILPMDNQAPDVADEGRIGIQPGLTEDFTLPFQLPIWAKDLTFVILPVGGWSADQVEVPLGQ